MYRRPPYLSTREEDTYDYLVDDLDEQEQVLISTHLKTALTVDPSDDICSG